MGNEQYELLLLKIGEELAELRKEKGYTSHASFAADFDLPRIQYWRLERGKANCTIKSLHRVLAIHEITIEQFFATRVNGNRRL